MGGDDPGRHPVRATIVRHSEMGTRRNQLGGMKKKSRPALPKIRNQRPRKIKIAATGDRDPTPTPACVGLEFIFAGRRCPYKYL
jgi:hypothetical protein